MDFRPNITLIEIIKEGRLEELILETFILVLIGIESHGKNSIS